MKLATFPYKYFTGLSAILLLSSLFLRSIKIDIYLFNNYLTIHLPYLCWSLCIIQIFLIAIYSLFKNLQLSLQLIKIHVLFTILASLGFIGFFGWANTFYNPRPMRYVDYQYWDSLKTNNHTSIIVILLLIIFILGQISLIVNLIQGSLKNHS